MHIGVWLFLLARHFARWQISRVDFPGRPFTAHIHNPPQYNIGYHVDCLALADINCEASFTEPSSAEDVGVVGWVRLIFIISALSNGYT
jgi:hypothetical protein